MLLRIRSAYKYAAIASVCLEQEVESGKRRGDNMVSRDHGGKDHAKDSGKLLCNEKEPLEDFQPQM